MKKTSKKFLDGALVGAALGVAAGIFATSTTGKEMERGAKEKLAEFYKTVAPRIKRAKKLSEEEYKQFISKALVNYNKTGKFSDKDLENITKEAHSSWKHLKKHL